MKRIVAFEVLEAYHLNLTFDDGKVKRVDLEPHLWGEVFQPLKDPQVFRKAFLEDGTIRWPNGADFDPDVLYYDGPPPWARAWTEPRELSK